MNKRRIRIELLKFDEEDVKYRHFNTAIASNYQELLVGCNFELVLIPKSTAIYINFSF